ncbi:proline-rich proteoglycan 2-like [Panicum virgatum]|uniref:proline-rich proteoglycan 2-like n=1 Tax=Panicum virgatum TaxID=38727 RepID=UPI0019D597BA|nr:proline-rich proteoglycan 2-like [Panicum virgatum]
MVHEQSSGGHHHQQLPGAAPPRDQQVRRPLAAPDGAPSRAPGRPPLGDVRRAPHGGRAEPRRGPPRRAAPPDAGRTAPTATQAPAQPPTHGPLQLQAERAASRIRRGGAGRGPGVDAE